MNAILANPLEITYTPKLFLLFILNYAYFLQNGLLNGAPFLLSYFSSVVFCYIADYLVTKNVFGLTNIRKIFTFLCKYRYNFKVSLQIIDFCFLIFNNYFSSSNSWPSFVIHWFFWVQYHTCTYCLVYCCDTHYCILCWSNGQYSRHSTKFCRSVFTYLL